MSDAPASKQKKEMCYFHETKKNYKNFVFEFLRTFETTFTDILHLFVFTTQNVEFSYYLEPKPCAAYTCRMFCPHGFALAQDGCPLCKCRDPCEDIRCPDSLACHLEELACSDPPCPPVPTCKYNTLPRYTLSLYNQAWTGVDS